MNRKIYKKIAKNHGVSVAEIKRDMQSAIDDTYKNPTFQARCVDCAGEKPEIEEFIDHIARRAMTK